MRFYVVGFNEPTAPSTRFPRGVPVLGDALVYASGARDALSRVREVGLVPDPGDIYVLGGRGWKDCRSETPIDEWMKDEARRDPSGVYIVWKSR